MASSNKRTTNNDNISDERQSVASSSTASTVITSNVTSSPLSQPNKKIKVVFIHLDLGIGGAEQLVLQLATASQNLGHSVKIITTRCDQDHCFESVCFSKSGRLATDVTIYGNWIPSNIFGGIATTFCSTIRMVWLSYQVTRLHKSADIVVIDVLPTSLPLILMKMPSTATLFYCHFPDKLLIRSSSTTTSTFKKFYRNIMDILEEITMKYADTLVVNSKFTHSMVTSTFTKLNHNEISVLYPALDTSRLTQPNSKSKTNKSPIVSLNRFERKKNIELLIKAYAYLMKKKFPSKDLLLPKVIIAGGYDIQNIENVEYRGELQQLVNKFDLQTQIEFRMDISDEERATLFQTALCVVYTPDKEHFGIVPLEAMYAETPVIAVNSGGPTETIIDGKTGFLCEPTPEAFGDAIYELVENPIEKATKMGQIGRKHVENTFGSIRLEKEWKTLIEKTLQKPKQRQQSGLLVLWTNTLMYIFETIIAVIVCLLLTLILRHYGILNPNQSILGAIRNGLGGDEL